MGGGHTAETPSETGDDLEAIRARLRREIVAAQRGPATAVPARSARPVDLDRASFDRFLAEHARVAVDVWAPWCGPCRAFSPILEGVAGRLPSVAFGKVNADNEPALAGRYGVTGIPTVLVFRSGRLVDRWSGAYPAEVVETRLRRVLALSGGPSAAAPADRA